MKYRDKEIAPLTDIESAPSVAKLSKKQELVASRRLETTALFTRGIVDLRTSQLYIAAAMYNVELLRFYKDDGCETMTDFYALHNMNEGTGKRLLRIGRGIAEALRSAIKGHDGFITMKDVNRFSKAKLSGTDLIQRVPLLLTDGEFQKVDDDMTVFEHEAKDEIKKQLDREFAQSQGAAKGSAKKRSYDTLMPPLLAAATDAAKRCHELWHGYGGVQDANKVELEYIARLLEYYATRPARKMKDPECPFISYDEAQDRLSDGEDFSKSRPDVYYALNIGKP